LSEVGRRCQVASHALESRSTLDTERESVELAPLADDPTTWRQNGSTLLGRHQAQGSLTPPLWLRIAAKSSKAHCSLIFPASSIR